MSHDTAPLQPAGPLKGLRVVEFAGIGPGPFACMLLSDMGADVVTVARPGKLQGGAQQIINRGRSVVQADLKDPAARMEVLALLATADVLVEGFRPGVMERLGLGPADLEAANPRLVFGRMTGWGQTGPLAQAAGHDINYIAITGALHAIGPKDGPPSPPLNLVGDYGGGALYLVIGILAALQERQTSGRGQVVDAAISDGTASLMTMFVEKALKGGFTEQRGSNTLDGGAPYYGSYRTADGEYVSIGAIEPQFFALFCERIGVDPTLRQSQHQLADWPALRAEFERLFASKTQAQWCNLLEGTDACFAPVLPLSRAQQHPHQLSRATFVQLAGVHQPAPAPRFSRTPSAIQGVAPSEADAIADILQRWSPR